MNSRILKLIAALFALAMVAAACGSDDSDTASTGDPVETTETTEAASADDPGTIVDVAIANDFTTLVAAVQAADLVDTLSGEGPFTVFAPTDEAFAALLVDLDLTDETLADAMSTVPTLT